MLLCDQALGLSVVRRENVRTRYVDTSRYVENVANFETAEQAAAAVETAVQAGIATAVGSNAMYGHPVVQLQDSNLDVLANVAENSPKLGPSAAIATAVPAAVETRQAAVKDTNADKAAVAAAVQAAVDETNADRAAVETTDQAAVEETNAVLEMLLQHHANAHW